MPNAQQLRDDQRGVKDEFVIGSDMNKETEISVRLIRGGEEPKDEDWKDSTPAERIEAVWTLTKICMTWAGQHQTDEPRLQRTITRLQRNKR